jgi:hypothetical protein
MASRIVAAGGLRGGREEGSVLGGFLDGDNS